LIQKQPSILEGCFCVCNPGHGGKFCVNADWAQAKTRGKSRRIAQQIRGGNRPYWALSLTKTAVCAAQPWMLLLSSENA